MWIDPTLCTGCGQCVPYCPMGAIARRKANRKENRPALSAIDLDECVECYVCLRAGVCPEAAIKETELAWPRILRRAFSDPIYVHQGTDVPGRGTEEMKTNDVTGRFKDGCLGLGMEFGRPGTGTRLGETEKAIKRLLALGVELEPLNPLTQLLADPRTGDLRPEVRGEKVLSAIVEAVIPLDKAQAAFQAVRETAEEVETVFSLDLIGKVAADGSLPFLVELDKAGLARTRNGKVNLGLGRPAFTAWK